jgi:hypothetical protein
MSDMTEDESWREDAWRNRPAPEEVSRLRSGMSNPAISEELQVERRLTAALGRLSQAPVPSNFTARVLQAVERERAVAARRRPRWISHWLPKLAFSCVLLSAGVIAWNKVETVRKAEMIQSVATISASAPSPEILQDFEAIRALSRTPPADEQLLALMQ